MIEPVITFSGEFIKIRFEPIQNQPYQVCLVAENVLE